MSVLIRKITLAALMAAVVGGTLALPASSNAGPVAHAAKCKKAKKGKKKKKKCKGAGQSGSALPGQATHPNVTQAPAFQVSDLSVASSPVLGGTGTSGQVTISAPAPSGGQPVSLTSSDPSVTLPGSVVVAAGQSTASFSVGTTPATSVTATLTAAIGGSNDTAQLKVVSAPSVESVSLERQCFTPAISAANRVTLDVPAPADTVVQLVSDQPSLSVAPGSTTVPAGSKTAFFGVTTSAPVSPVTAIVTATLGTSFASDTTSVSATAPTPAVSSLSIQPNSVTVGATPTATVTLDCEAPSGGAVVNLTSDLPGVAAPAQSTVTVLQDQLSATFTIDTSTSGTANIGAAFGAASPVTAPVTVNNLGT